MLIAIGQDSVVAYATAKARATRGFWTGLGYFTLRAQYSLGWSAAPIAGYALLGLPAAAVAGAIAGAPGAATTIAEQVLLEMAEVALGSPEKAAQRVAVDMRDRALKEYRRAYEIGNRIINGGTIDREDAIAFLEARWGVARLNAAGALYRASLKSAPATRRTTKEATWFGVAAVVDKYQLSALRTPKALPVAEASFFIKDLTDPLERSGEGLGGYEPYRRYVQQLQSIEAEQEAERSKYYPATPIATPPRVDAGGGLDDSVRTRSDGCGSLGATLGRRILLVLDLSDSMNEGDKLAQAKAAAAAVVRQLAPSDRVAFVTFGGGCQVRSAAPFGTERQEVLDAIGRAAADGRTPLATALREAAGQIERLDRGSDVTVVVVTDGEETCGGDVGMAAQALGEALRLVLVGRG